MPRATSWVTRRHSSVIRSVRLRQVHETNLVVAAPKELLAHLECYSVLGEAAKCGATFFSRGDDGGAGAKKADDARSAAVHRGDEQRGEPASGVLPNPGPRRRPLAANCRLAPRGHVRPRTVVYSYSGALTPKRCLCGFPHFATSRRDAQQLLVAEGRAPWLHCTSVICRTTHRRHAGVSRFSWRHRVANRHACVCRNQNSQASE